MKNRSYLFLLMVVSFGLSLSTCRQRPKTLFHLLAPDETGIMFSNTIQETDSFNIFTYEYIYNGGGVAIADFNNDGLQDIFFSGNQVGNRLYLNEGKFKFKDVTEKANVNVKGRWNSGIAAVDINNDGWMDLYVCATTRSRPEDRRNMLFVNQGLDASGQPVFKEMAAEYKVDFNGHSVMTAFLDYDRDGDLDMYILVNEKVNNRSFAAFRPKITDGSAANNDHLLRNEGNGTFTDVTMEAGITYEGFGLGLAISDFNNDGWPDIYVSNDYLSNDILYLNKKDGIFQNVTAEFLGHESQFSMGNDAADMNNDGLTDIVTLDMLPEINERKKTTIGNKSYQTYINNEKFHYQYQYVRNMLQLNNGVDKGVKFSEIGQLAGVYQTEWSWSPLLADFDNDGNKDLAVTTGFPKDITDKDFANYRVGVMNIATPTMMSDSLPVVKVPNYAFHNNGDLTFSDVSSAWGLNEPSFSNGAAFVDLDNDGDLDYVVNNINGPAFIYENSLYSETKTGKEPGYFRVKLRGPGKNRSGIGVKVTLYQPGGKIQYQDHSVYRGYLSSVEGIVHFGLGASAIDSARIVWPDGKEQLLKQVAPNQVFLADYSNATEVHRRAAITKAHVFSDASHASKIKFKHEQRDVVDFDIQRTLPHKYSEFGPALAVGDIDGDHLDDFFVGGPTGKQGIFFIQQKNGEFKAAADRIKEQTKLGEDEGVLLFDADGDNDLDLYIVGGGFEWTKNDPNYQDRLYINDGKGFFAENKSALPVMTSSGSCVRAADIDGDGDLDLFVGGRVVPREYPYAPDSYILINEGGKFTDATDRICPGLRNAGMVADAVWSDFDGDGKVDLVIAGELMPVRFYKNNGRTFAEVPDSLIAAYKGWWNSIVAADFDQDGDIDYVVGNLGQNNYYRADQLHPVKVFAKDIDGNGSVDAITGCFFRMRDGSLKLCPVHFWDELNAQSPRFRKQFTKYIHYGDATFETLFSKDDLQGALMLDVTNSSSSYIENLGDGKFKMTALPLQAQFAPVFGMHTGDYDHDGYLDVMMVGNEFGNEVFSGRYDAMTGLLLKGDGHGKFRAIESAESGFYVGGDAKALVELTGQNGNPLFIASQNKDSLRVFSNLPVHAETIDIQRLDSYAVVTFSSGKKQRVEFHYGEGFLSQSTRKFTIPAGTTEMIIYDFKGSPRKVELAKL